MYYGITYKPVVLTLLDNPHSAPWCNWKEIYLYPCNSLYIIVSYLRSSRKSFRLEKFATVLNNFLKRKIPVIIFSHQVYVGPGRQWGTCKCLTTGFLQREKQTNKLMFVAFATNGTSWCMYSYLGQFQATNMKSSGLQNLWKFCWLQHTTARFQKINRYEITPWWSIVRSREDDKLLLQKELYKVIKHMHHVLCNRITRDFENLNKPIKFSKWRHLSYVVN